MAANLLAPSDMLSSDSRQSPLQGARTALILLLCINLFNYIDRQVLSAVLPYIERDFFPKGDANAKAKLGLLSAAFTVVYLISAPIFGFLAERISRWRIIAVGV